MTDTRFPDAPPFVARLPTDKRGYPVPWFVPWIKGEPEFRAVDPWRAKEAHRRQLCWICGQRLGTIKAFVIGPMCAVNRVTAEPPSHVICSRFAVVACPFLSRPMAKRSDTSDLQAVHPPGLMIERNPGVSLIWHTQTYRAEKEGDGLVFRIGAPIKLEWFALGRTATRAEIIESIETGLPLLRKFAQEGGPVELAALRAAIERAVKLVPAE